MVSCNNGQIEIQGSMAEIKTDIVCIISALSEDKKTLEEKADFQADLFLDLVKGTKLCNELDLMKK